MPRDRNSLPPPSRPPRGPNWSRLAVWTLWGAILMLGWLLYPAAECTTAGRHDIRIGQVDDDGADVSETDTGRVEEGVGFFGQWRDLITRCYDENPIGQQVSWKKKTAMGLAGATVLFWLLGRLTRPRPASMDD